MLRRATIDDVSAVVELRAVIYAEMGDERVLETPWREQAAAWFTRHIGVDACVCVVDLDGVLVAAALGYVHTAVPSPSNLAGRMGHVSNVVTLEGHRRRGYARICLEALLTWFRDETPVDRIDLVASDDGVALYESLGWERRTYPTLRLLTNRDQQ